jgi:methylenetetrahydrofolate--tRNA-(uracil-5-)-methyltransferase
MRRPHAVVQLRQDNREGTLYNMVGFQTKMTHAEQKRVFAMIPGLERACFVRLGSLHRNTFIDAPKLLDATLRLRGNSQLFLAGQIVGVEGYVESAAAGLLAGLNVARIERGGEPVVPPPTTALGSLLAYISDPTRRDFQPMNANYGLFPPLPMACGLYGREKKLKLAERALRDMAAWAGSVGALAFAGRPNEARVS